MARRSSPRKRTYKKKVSKVVKQYVKRTLAARTEDKFVDTLWSALTPSYSYAALSAVTMPAQGTTNETRIGDRIRPTKLQIRGSYYGANSHLLRLIFFRWHPNTTPTGANVLDNTYVSSFRAPFAPYEDSTKPMYTILKDKTMALSATGNNVHPFKFTISRKKLANMDFTAGSSTVGTNLIFCLMVQDGFATLNTIDMVGRLWFEDN